MIREIDAYTMNAIGSGCFMNGDRQQKIRDPLTGERRSERVFTTDREIELEDIGIVEIGERAAAEIADQLGWIAPQTHSALVTEMSSIERERDDLVSKIASYEQASNTNVIQAAEAITEAERLRDENEKMSSELRSIRGTLGALTKNNSQLQSRLDKVTSFGDD